MALPFSHQPPGTKGAEGDGGGEGRVQTAVNMKEGLLRIITVRQIYFIVPWIEYTRTFTGIGGKVNSSWHQVGQEGLIGHNTAPNYHTGGSQKGSCVLSYAAVVLAESSVQGYFSDEAHYLCPGTLTKQGQAEKGKPC